MTLFDTDSMRWGGFTLAGRASPQLLLELYTHLHLALPGAWLHDADCELHTAESFGATIRAASPALEAVGPRAPPAAACPIAALYLDCGASRPQLKRNP
jgi:hypothetical protein